MGQHLLVPVDGSSHSEKALEYTLNEFSGAKITILHVLNPVNSLGYGDEEYFNFEAYQEEVEHKRERGNQMLADYCRQAVERGFTVETMIKEGKPAKQILASIEDTDIDQIIMGSRGRTGVGRVLFGSVAETVTRRATVPVTIVR